MKRKKGAKSKAAKMRDLPPKTLKAKTAKGVKGGDFSYGKIEWKYTPQKND